MLIDRLMRDDLVFFEGFLRSFLCRWKPPLCDDNEFVFYKGASPLLGFVTEGHALPLGICRDFPFCRSLNLCVYGVMLFGMRVHACGF